MKKKLLFSGMIALAMGFTAANAQLYNYTNDLGGVPASTATNTTGSNLARVDGALPITGCPDGFNSNKYSEATTFGVTRPSVEFSISPNTGYQLDVTSVSVNARRNNKGPALWRFAYSTDGGATWTNNGSDYSVTAVTCGTSNTLTWDMPDFSSEGTVLVRVYSYGATSALNGVGTLTNLVLSGGVSYADIDNDGYTSDVDCDDNNADINPGASETCNGIDDNCSGTADEGVTTTYYADADGGLGHAADERFA
ncbi:MAG TPA: putative metal-binding motif-containing protein, partial [Chitinophagales bacterium]|nr:putative metal-binding motif-containing protein [Chitinophagales bacterium]